MKRLSISALALLTFVTTAGMWWHYATRPSSLHSEDSSRADAERYLSHAKPSLSTPPKDACAKLVEDAYQTLLENSRTRSDLNPIVWSTGVLTFWAPERWPPRLATVMADFERQYSEALRKLRLAMACSCEDGDCLERDSIIVAHPIETLAIIQLLKVSAHEKLSRQQDDLAWDSLRCQVVLANILSGRGDKNVAGSCWPHIAETAAMLSARSVAEQGMFGQLMEALHEQDLQKLTPQRSSALRGLVEMGLLAERFRIAHGTAAESVAMLFRDTTSAPPIDPYSGEPYRYQPDKSSFLLYGVSKGGPGRDAEMGNVWSRGLGEEWTRDDWDDDSIEGYLKNGVGACGVGFNPDNTFCWLRP